MIPVLPGGQLEILLEYCIDLAKRGVDTQLEHVQRFYRYSFIISQLYEDWGNSYHISLFHN